jgi:tannase/feruloyl esterase
MTFDPERDIPALRAGLAQHVFQEDADISAFLGRGGKLLLWHGFNDPGPSPLSTIEYFDAVQGTVPAAKDGVRLFLAPGVLHCRGGAGPDRFDALTALEQWVEKGTPPASMIATRADGALSRPLCPYPQLARYKGKGNTNAAASFECGASYSRRR